MNLCAFAPLSHWPTNQELPLPCGICIVSADFSAVAWPGDDVRRVLRETKYWIRYPFTAPAVDSEEAARAFSTVDSALSACQIVAPTGGEAITLLADADGKQPLLRLVVHNPKMHTTRAARMAFAFPRPLDDLPAVAGGVINSSSGGSVRLRNALSLFRLGLQVPELHIQLLLWVTALDALVMAIKPKVFHRRICNFLGPLEYVYPDLHPFPRPTYCVQDVALELFNLRSTIAHGQEIPEKYWRDEVQIYEGKQQLRQVLCDSALFLLSDFLRRIFRNGLSLEVGQTRKWKMHLDKQT